MITDIFYRKAQTEQGILNILQNAYHEISTAINFAQSAISRGMYVQDPLKDEQMQRFREEAGNLDIDYKAVDVAGDYIKELGLWGHFEMVALQNGPKEIEEAKRRVLEEGALSFNMVHLRRVLLAYAYPILNATRLLGDMVAKQQQAQQGI